MLARRLYDRQGNYNGSFGTATKSNIYDIAAAPIDQRIFGEERDWAEMLKDGATSYLTDGSRGTRFERDMNIDIKNPREELPKDKASILAMDTIPNLIDQQIDVSRPEDYEAHIWARAFQMSEMNSKAQDSLFTDPKSMENPALVQEGNTGTPVKGMSQDELYHTLGAAGIVNDHLYTDQDGAYLWSVTQTNAF